MGKRSKNGGAPLEDFLGFRYGHDMPTSTAEMRAYEDRKRQEEREEERAQAREEERAQAAELQRRQQDERVTRRERRRRDFEETAAQQHTFTSYEERVSYRQHGDAGHDAGYGQQEQPQAEAKPRKERKEKKEKKARKEKEAKKKAEKEAGEKYDYDYAYNAGTSYDYEAGYGAGGADQHWAPQGPPVEHPPPPPADRPERVEKAVMEAADRVIAPPGARTRGWDEGNDQTSYYSSHDRWGAQGDYDGGRWSEDRWGGRARGSERDEEQRWTPFSDSSPSFGGGRGFFDPTDVQQPPPSQSSRAKHQQGFGDAAAQPTHAHDMHGSERGSGGGSGGRGSGRGGGRGSGRGGGGRGSASSGRGGGSGGKRRGGKGRGGAYDS